MKVIFYQSPSGRDEISNYLAKQSIRSRTECNAVITGFKIYGFDLPASAMKKLAGQNRLWELRIDAEVQHRILFTVTKKSEAVLLNAFIKKTQQTPMREIKTALQRRKLYENY